MKDGRKAFLATPGYGRQTNAAGRAIWRASADMDSVWVAGENSSLLAANFNTLWCEALNVVHSGKRLDYFAMIHDDISAPDGWLDTLIDELEARNLDILGVVVPIKDTRGLSSCALHREGDNWQVAARLTMREIFRLPETFTSDDLNHKLLLNTGLWVCRFDPSWVKEVHFEINDRIVFDTRLNCYRPQNESEDWFFSRLGHELNLKIGATRKIKVAHHGEMDFTNDVPWGSCEFDTAVSESLVPFTDRDGFRWPYDVNGWLFHEEGKALWRLARGKRVLEIGAYCGLSTICLAQSADYVLSVDPHDGSGTPEPQETFSTFQQNLERYGVSDRVQPFIGTLDEYEMPAGEFDLVFIDGKHDLASVRNDIRLAMARLAPGGLIAFHDYREKAHPDVDVAIGELVSAGGSLVLTEKNLAVVRPPAQIAVEN